MDIPKCDECGATEFIHLREGWKPNLISADEYFKDYGRPKAVPAILQYYNYIARCKACGKEYKYTVMG